MKFIYKDLGARQPGDIVEVGLTTAANVRLMDTNNFMNYKNGAKHIYTGGLIKQSPTRLQVPTFGHWHLTVDTVGLTVAREVSATVRILPKS